MSLINYMGFFGLLLASGVVSSDPGDKTFTAPSRARSNIQIPRSCIIKAQALVNSSAMSSSHLAASQSFVNVLTASGTSLVIDYVLTPNLIQKGGVMGANQASSQDNGKSSYGDSSAPTTTEISIKGYLSSVQLTLVQASGTSYATAQVFNSPAEAQAIASTAVASNLIQSTSNQASMNLDVIATSIHTLQSMISISSDLQSQIAVNVSGSAGVTGVSSTGLPTALTHALTLADIISHIDINAMVSFDGKNLIVSSPLTNVSC
jgi:hypothetical protein